MNRVGVFICHCGVNIASTVDVEALTEYASKSNEVVVAKSYKYMCSDVGATLIKDAIKEHSLDALVLACCSPRMHEHTFRQVASPILWLYLSAEVAWIHWLQMPHQRKTGFDTLAL